MPSATNTTVNDRQNTIAGSRILSVPRSPDFISASDRPDTADR